MKTLYSTKNLSPVALLAALIFSFSFAFGQGNKEGNVEIHIEKGVNGHLETFDPAFTTPGDGHSFTPRILQTPPFPFRIPNPVPFPDPVIMPPDTVMYRPGDPSKNKRTMEDIDLDTKDVKQQVIIYKVIVKKNFTEPTDVNEAKHLSSDNIEVYPNPGNGKFNLAFTLPSKGNLKIKVSDLNGREILSEELAGFSGSYNNQFDLSARGKGIYILTMEHGGKVAAKKIAVN